MAYFDGSNERAWLCKIATNKSLDYLKRAGRKSVPTEDVYFSAIAAPESVEEKYLEKEVRQKLYDSNLLTGRWPLTTIITRWKSVKLLKKQERT